MLYSLTDAAPQFLRKFTPLVFSSKCAILRRPSSSEPHTRVFPLTEGTWFSRCIITPSYILFPPPLPPLVPLYSSLKKIENAASWLNFADECIRHRIKVHMKCYTPSQLVRSVFIVDLNINVIMRK